MNNSPNKNTWHRVGRWNFLTPHFGVFLDGHNRVLVKRGIWPCDKKEITEPFVTHAKAREHALFVIEMEEESVADIMELLS